ncbi:MAG: trypsin-like peptidase domain-containing protein [Gemmatimonadota bacterium]|nr:MAG: trypsin-like peptidase domain-containing protein [Gemmatimonadota bacterium]
MQSKFIAGWLAGFGIALLLVGLLVFGPSRFLNGANEGSAGGPAPGPQTANRSAEALAARPLAPQRQTPVVEAAQRVTPSVVSVNVIRRTRVTPRSFWDNFFVPYGYEREVAGLGSGFAIAPGGYVLTNAHVVRGAVDIVVSAVDGSDHPAELIGSDDLSDLALLRIDAEIPVPEFGDSDELVIGEPAIAIGNPFGYLISNVEPTVTAGVISGVGRHILPTAFSGEEAGQEETVYADMIQTDASINPGNSGGPLANAEGQVIGVNSAIFSRSGGSQGLGFSIPINRARRVAEQLRTEGRVRRPWVGIEVGPAESDRSGRRRGATIVRVAPGSPAERAELRDGMEVIAVGGRPVKSYLDWEAELLDVAPGESLALRVRDDRGRERDVILPVEDLPSFNASRVEVLRGLELVTMTPAIRAERGLTSRAGALVASVSQAISGVTGLREGDLILMINRTTVENADDAAEMLGFLADRGNAIRLSYERDGYLRHTPIFTIE